MLEFKEISKSGTKPHRKATLYLPKVQKLISIYNEQIGKWDLRELPSSQSYTEYQFKKAIRERLLQLATTNTQRLQITMAVDGLSFIECRECYKLFRLSRLTPVEQSHTRYLGTEPIKERKRNQSLREHIESFDLNGKGIFRKQEPIED